MNDQCPMLRFLAERFIPDSFFENAYEAVGDYRRSLLKTAVARLYDQYAPAGSGDTVTTEHRKQGFISVRRRTPVDYVLLFLDAENRSPSRLLAGLLPALTSGAEQVFAVWTCSPDQVHPPMLTALELAGLENAACLSEGEIIPAPLHGNGVVLDYREASGWEKPLTEELLPEWTPPTVTCAGVYQDEADSFDLEALAFVHPDLEFEVWGKNEALPNGRFTPRSGSAEEFAAAGYDAAYCSGRLLPVASPLVLGRGHEGCWVWPDLKHVFFMTDSIFWGSEDVWKDIS